MRPLWKGYISFGLVNIPVQLYSAEKTNDLRFHLLDSRNQARVHYARVNEETGEEVPWDQVVKAYEYHKNNYVILEEADFKRASVKATKTIEIENFVRSDEVDYRYFARPYYLVPEKAGVKSYVLLRETLKRCDKMAIARVVIHGREHLAAIMPANHALLLDILRFEQELRAEQEFDLPTGSAKSHKINEREIAMAEQLVTAMSSSWKPESYHDEYRKALMSWIENKIKGKAEVEEEVPVADSTGEVVDLMTLMKQSLQQTGGKKTATKRKHRVSA
jgi:DNA end-binding protein Ku